MDSGIANDASSSINFGLSCLELWLDEGDDPCLGPGDELEVTGDRRVLFSVVQALSAADLLPDDVRTVPRTLEDVFVRVTGRAYDPRAAADLEGASR